MRTRQIPREVPDRAPYIKIEIGRGVHQMKAPSLHRMATLLGAASGLATVLAAIEGGVSDVRGAVPICSPPLVRSSDLAGRMRCWTLNQRTPGMCWHMARRYTKSCTTRAIHSMTSPG